MKYPKIPLAQSVILLCKAKNIKHIIISPGSRNAPLTIGFTNDSFFKCYSIVDERCAAFVALGIAQQTQQPVALVCTSGSALLNYYPAIAEAYFSNIPMVVLSADRPEHLIGIGDGQTINQENVFKNHIVYSANLKPDNPLRNSKEIQQALQQAILKKGPVHINIPFNEPLYETTSELLINPKILETKNKVKNLDQTLVEQLGEQWQKANKKMVVVGVLQPNSIAQKWLEVLANDTSVVVFTETTSNIQHPNFFPCIDKIIAPLTEESFKHLQPEILLTLGGLVVSKKIKAFLREYQPKQHWHIDELKANDTYFCLSQHVKVIPNSFFSSFFKKVKNSLNSNYQKEWLLVKKEREQKQQTYLNALAYSDLKVFQQVLKTLPAESILQLANSSTIRYTQLFELKSSIKVFCNRGTSGIDGSTSTAIGCAIANKKQTVFITGDLSFFYDSNALWNNYIPNNFRIILINNEGGGIFRILPGNKNTENFDTFFETKHNLTAKHLAKMYNFEYIMATSLDTINLALHNFYEEGSNPKILEIFTPRTTNDKVLQNYFKALQ
ncbi:MAG: 2-succinyl-5-enolpyruvyl-6-hydroxy-3-cyclohexene-1-carboxylic-acid synthase [Oceanihabitans sp.]